MQADILPTSDQIRLKAPNFVESGRLFGPVRLLSSRRGRAPTAASAPVSSGPVGGDGLWHSPSQYNGAQGGGLMGGRARAPEAVACGISGSSVLHVAMTGRKPRPLRRTPCGVKEGSARRPSRLRAMHKEEVA